MKKGDKISRKELLEKGWEQQDSMKDGCQLWVNNFLIAYLYFNAKENTINEYVKV
ncbi:MAG: hypothetical protein NDI62_03015 [Burkholderiales bacterium]|nr:hypothetical protein [Burkholderiales bacterium]